MREIGEQLVDDVLLLNGVAPIMQQRRKHRVPAGSDRRAAEPRSAVLARNASECRVPSLPHAGG